MNISPVPLLRFVSRLVRRDEKDSWTMARVDAEGGLRWISGSVKRDGEVRRGEKEARREWKKIYWPEHGRIGRIYIYTYVAREINITLWILRSLWKPCQVNKSIKFSHFIGRARVYDWSLRRAEEGESVYRWREMKGRGREKDIYKIKRSLRIRGRLTLPPLLHLSVQHVPSLFQTLGNWFLPSDPSWKSGDPPPSLEVMIF